MAHFNELKPFRFWCQKVLPLVYDDSLSYYELLCKIYDYMNKAITDLGVLEDSYIELENYVNNYFEDLDVTEEINNKLDEMAEDGTLSALIQPLFDTYTTTINNIVETQNENIATQNENIATQIATQNENIADQKTEIDELKGRMDSFSSLEEGSTTGDAELTDGRIDFTGRTWSNIGDAIRGITKWNNEFCRFTGLHDDGKYVPDYTIQEGYYLPGTHVPTANEDWNLTSMFPLMAGQSMDVRAYGSHGYTYIAEYNANGTFNKNIDTHSNQATSTYRRIRYCNRSNQIKYYRIAYRNDHSLTLLCSILRHDRKYWTVNDGYIRTSGDFVIQPWNEAGNYCITTPVLVKAGETIRVLSSGSANVATLFRCNANGVWIETIYSGGDEDNYYEYTPNTDGYYAATINTGSLYDFTVMPPRKDAKETLGNTKEKCVISFIFDDALETDEEMYETFCNKNMKCGFAVPLNSGAVIQNFVRYYDGGFDILSHSTDPTPMSTDEETQETIRYKMVRSKYMLERHGWCIRGWVTPSSVLNENYQSLLNNVYDYAFTQATGLVAYNTKNTDVRELHRVIIPSSSSDAIDIVDGAIANNGFLVFYFHTRDLTDTYRSTIDALLDYIKTQEKNENCICLTPNDAFDYYYN